MFTRMRPLLSPIASLAAAGLLLGGLMSLHFTSRPAHAQAPPQAADASGLTPKDTQELITDLDDMDVLHVLLPVKLTPEQMDKLATTITDAKADYDKRVAALTNPPLAKLADEIRSTHEKALRGTMTSADFDERVKVMQKTFVAKRQVLDNENIGRLGPQCKTIVTAEQFAVCVKLEKDAYKQMQKYNEKSSDNQYFNAYVTDVFISNPHIVALLKEMKAAQTPK